MSFTEILEIIRDFHSQLDVSELLNSGLDLDKFENMSWEEIHNELSEHFESEK